MQRVLATLRQSGLIQRRDGSWCPVLVDLDWLADKWDGQKSGSDMPKVRWVEPPEGATVTIPTESSVCAAPLRPPRDCVTELFTRLMRCANLPDTERRVLIGQAVVATAAWKEDDDACYLEIVERPEQLSARQGVGSGGRVGAESRQRRGVGGGWFSYTLAGLATGVAGSATGLL